MNEKYNIMNKTQGETGIFHNNLEEPILSLGQYFIILTNWIFKADITCFRVSLST